MSGPNFQLTIVTEKGNVQTTTLSGYGAESMADKGLNAAKATGIRYGAIFVYNELGKLDYVRGEYMNPELPA